MKQSLVIFSVCAALTTVTLADTNSTQKKRRIHKIPSRPAVTEHTPKQPVIPDDEGKIEQDRFPWTKNFSGTAAFVSNYMFRGMSQSRNLPAAQTGLTFNTPLNIYFSIWGSNVSYVGTPASLELDTIIGYRNTYGDNVAYDISVARYNYPAYRSYNYNELNAVATFYFLQGAIGYSANVYNVHQTGIYYSGGINYNIPAKWAFGFCDLNLTALIGHYSLPRAGGNSYSDYNIQLSKGFNIYKVSLQWTNTDGRQNNSPFDSQQLVGQVAASF